MADTQGTSVAGGDDPPHRLPPSAKGKAPALQKPKKKKGKKGGSDDWQTTLAVVEAQERIEQGGRVAQFSIVDQAGSLAAPEGPPPPPLCRSGR
jgi:hypothetical protein